MQRRVRRKAALEEITPILTRIDVPLQALVAPNTAPTDALLHLSKAVREQIRAIPHFSISSEKTIIKRKKSIATAYATETATFVGGAYITDPIANLYILCAQSEFLVVGGNCGGGLTKLGVTYAAGEVQKFACLLVYDGGDSWMELQDCRAQGLTRFTGASASFPHIWAVFQHLIDERGAFLNGDWKFINSVLGLKSPSATHPCPICIVHKNQLNKTARYRNAGDTYSKDFAQEALLHIKPERIFPTPLHLFLGH